MARDQLRLRIWILLLGLCARAAAAIVADPLPPSATVSGDIQLTANGTAVPVEHYRDRHVANFTADGAIALEVKIKAPITSYSIHPSSFGLKGTVEGDTLKFSLAPDQFNPQPAYLIIRLNDLENFVVMVDPPETNVPGRTDPGVLDVTARPYSADPSGKLLATAAIQAAIDHASQAAGGIVYVPPGIFRVQSLQLKSDVTLYLAGGAVIQGSNLLADYQGNSAFAATAKNSLPPVIEAHEFKNIAIRGRGWIDAAEGTMYTPDGAPHQVVSGGLYRRGTIRAIDGTGFKLNGVVARDAGGWSVYLTRVENIRINRLKLLGPLWSRNDGIDIGGCNAVIDQCLVYTGDDNFCTKATIPNYPLHDVHFRNSIGYSNSAGVKAGMQVMSPQSEIYFENIDIIHAGRGLVVEHHGENNKKGQTPHSMQNIYFTDIRVEQVAGKGGTSRNPIQISSALPGSISNIFFKRVSVGNFGPKPSLISGYDAQSPVTNVVFDHLTIGGKPIDQISAADMKTNNAAEIKFQP